MIRKTEQTDISPIMAILTESGQFDSDGIEHVRATLEQHLAGADDAIWLTVDDGEPVGVAYCAPEAVTSGTWNLLMLWTHEDRHNKGYGSALVKYIEDALEGRGARLLIVETSGLAEFAAARAFYVKCGFVHEATIKNFFADGDDKIVFTKPLVGNVK